MNYILFSVPSAVLMSSVIVYFLLSKESISFIERIRLEKYRKAHFISLQLIREIIVFFGSSKTSRETDRAIQTMFDIGKLKENEISQIDLSAIPEISLL